MYRNIPSTTGKPAIYLLKATVFVKFEEKLSKCAPDKNSYCPSKLHTSTVKNWKSVQIYSHMEIKIDKF